MVHVASPTADAAPSLRSRGRGAKRRAFLDEAMRLVHADGLDALTIKALAARVGCSVGALYRHFDSKDALVIAMEAEAIQALADAHDRAEACLGEHLAGLDDEPATLARLVAFGAMVAAARHAYPCEFGLQQRLLSALPLGLDPAETARVVPVATAMMQRPASRIGAAEAAGWLCPGVAFERAVQWVAALGGVLQLDRIDWPMGLRVDTDRLAHQLTLDLLRGWGADPAALAVAAERVTPAVAHDLLACTTLQEVSSR